MAWSREPVEVLDRDAALALRPFNLDGGFERGEGDVLVGGVGGDAIFAGAENREHAVVAVDGRTAGAGVALVAWVDSVAEVDAAGPLEEIAASSRHIAELRRSAGEQSLREDWVVALNRRVVGDIGVTGECSDDAGRPSDVGSMLIERKTVNVDDFARALDVELHQVDEGGTASDETDLRALLSGRGLAAAWTA